MTYARYMQKLFLDIETIPAGEESRETLKVLFEKKRKDDDKFEDFVARTSFDGAFGQILCIGYAFDNQPVGALYNKDDERETLRQFWELARNASLFIGHNVMDFDLRFIYQRSIILGVRPSLDLNFARYRSNPIFDTMKEWVKWSNSNVGLETLALALGIPSPKDGIDGSQVAAFHAAGKDDEIVEYCKRDVETTRDVYRRMIFEKNGNTLF
jgi:predicted PolB exonuclease-like 3'-5' exonuclease